MSERTIPTPSNPTGWKFETQQIHAGQEPDAATGARALPIYQTTSFVFKDSQQAADRFALAELGPIYTRINNPTQEAVEKRIAALEGGVDALLLASGQAATTYALINVAGTGDHIVASPSLYGGSYNLLKYTLKNFGIETTFVEDPYDLEAWKAAVQPNTKAFFGETLPNPRGDVFDIEGVAGVAHEAGVPLIVDNTIPTPYLLNPIQWGADVVVHSATKYLGGHGTSVGGVIVDSGNFDYGKDPEKFPLFNTPDEGYGGLVYARDLGPDSPFGVNVSYIIKARVGLLRDLGSSISPTNAFNIAIGLETLSLRVERHIENTRKVAEYLGTHEAVESVTWAGLPSSPYYELAQKYIPNGPGAVLGFTLKNADATTAQNFVNALRLHSLLVNVGDVRSLVVHPASTTHSQSTDEELAAIGINPAFIRLSVGIEHIDDILADLELGFEAIS
ncbi:O-acetylhomoserine aminocarboxypropyltransferase/cysteine synthase family protein [Rothia sp. ZJ1223]|uniref:O-acetylhomoserine aminocarboxypropyltransferase/cysteine synthase family protein n=1 Tax=Rothia sp. ZJ1223 TaxID=2811098 RepID=UPI0019596D67|nr:PLP-dependent transferase [Rothia sp. ZJ1223]MBM7051353.1 aminotransferase class V-fold PLP-dependent enzyme [Rothia sp. ZJ1223]